MTGRVLHDLSRPQEQMLIYLRWIGTDGFDAPRGHPVLAALGRRGLAEYRGTRARPRVEAWHATPAGTDHIDALRAAATDMEIAA